MHTGDEVLTIGGLAAVTGLGVETIRFYQRKHLLPTPARRYGSIRRYSGTDVARLSFVKRAQRAGFSLDEVRDLLRLDDGMHCAAAAAIAGARLADLRARLADLTRIEATLSQLVDQCRRRHGRVSCPLIANLREETSQAPSTLR
ncbi:MAG: MerR family DNA-binding protein [Gammaproteobacteria bacterium]